MLSLKNISKAIKMLLSDTYIDRGLLNYGVIFTRGCSLKSKFKDHRNVSGDRKVAKNYWTQKRCDMMPFDLL